MKVTFLGTCHGYPEKGRDYTSVAIETGGCVYILDAGADVYGRMMNYGVDVNFYEMVKNAEKVAGEKMVEKLIQEGYLTEKCKNNDKINIGFFTAKYRNTIIFNKMRDMVKDYLTLWYV